MSDNHTQKQLVKTARIAGTWYLLMAISGVLGFMVFHPRIFDASDPQTTLSNLVSLDSFARIRLLFEFAIVVSQALTAVWFYKLFRKINEGAAWALGVFGVVNAVAIMISAISMGSAIAIANTSSLSSGDKVILIALLNSIIDNAWGVGGLFFGLWLIPMGFIITDSKRMPLWLGRILIIGGIGYILSTIVKYIGAGDTLPDLLVVPATVAEFWMIGYLFAFGIRPDNSNEQHL